MNPVTLGQIFFCVDTAHSQEFSYVFCFDSCKTLPNVNTATIYTRQINSFKTTAIMDAKWQKLYASLFLMSVDETT